MIRLKIAINQNRNNIITTYNICVAGPIRPPHLHNQDAIINIFISLIETNYLTMSQIWSSFKQIWCWWSAPKEVHEFSSSGHVCSETVGDHSFSIFLLYWILIKNQKLPEHFTNCKSSTLHSTRASNSGVEDDDGWHSIRIRVGKLNCPSGTRPWFQLKFKENEYLYLVYLRVRKDKSNLKYLLAILSAEISGSKRALKIY